MFVNECYILMFIEVNVCNESVPELKQKTNGLEN
jgi:hypothetical protein